MAYCDDVYKLFSQAVAAGILPSSRNSYTLHATVQGVGQGGEVAVPKNETEDFEKLRKAVEFGLEITREVVVIVEWR
jgi:hypothetical protein